MPAFLLFLRLSIFNLLLLDSIKLSLSFQISRSGLQPRVFSSPFPSRLHSSSLVEYIQENLDTPDEKIISAVERAKDRRLTVADAAALSGTDLLSAQRSLTLLASLTGGDLEVSSEGDIVYSFNKDFQSALLKRSNGQRLKVLWRKVFPFLFYLFRISFGLILLSSLALITSTFILASASSSSSSDDDSNGRSRRGPSSSSGYFIPRPYGLFDGIFDFFIYRPDYGYYSTPARNRGSLGFLESFFSYIFGDGNPNQNIATEQVILQP